jgi:S-adenosylmethionine:tRNA ribosyltransferase-isomerase
MKEVDLSLFDYHLPPGRIAQEPLADRAASRMLVVDRARGAWRDARFRDLPSYLGPGGCLVLNNSRVFASRLFGRRDGCTGVVEVFLVRPLSPDLRRWETLVRPGRKMEPGQRFHIPGPSAGEAALRGQVIERGGYHGERVVKFDFSGDFYEIVNRAGHVPLPKYIKRADTATDRERYQTVYAERPGSVAAPTAGLHFTPEILAACRAAGASIAHVTLHVGLGTFQPLDDEKLASGKLHAEFYDLSATTAGQIRRAQRVIAVGTTAVRTLESGPIEARSGDTDLFIRPGFEFRCIHAMLTNFHLPQSSLLMLVSAFAGRELILDAYRHAVQAEYRFFSYGDCMLIL